MPRNSASSRRVPLHPPAAALLLSVIGTGTEVGKTIVAAGLARAFRRAGLDVGVFKPFAADPARRPSGEGFSTDADLLARAAEIEGGAAEVCGQLFRAPLAPLAAAEIERRRVDLGLALRQARAIARLYDLTLVEGCGGWEVPLTWSKTTADYFAALGAPVVLVALAGLGTINHTLLTLEAVRGRGLKVLGIVLNRMSGGASTEAERTNPAILARFARAPIWGPVPHRRSLAGKSADRISVASLPDLRAIAGALLRELDRTRRSGTFLS